MRLRAVWIDLMSPLVSIGIPTYNRSRLLRQAITSVLRQSVQDFEIIVSDDCSTDDTAEVVEHFGDPRIRYHRTATNLRPPRNWNECARLAQGVFFALLPDDDVWCPEFLAAMVTAFQAHPDAGFVQCAYCSADEQLREIRTVQASATELVLRGESALIWQLEHLACVPAAVLFRRAAMVELGLWREDYWDDWAFIVRMAYRYGFIFTPSALACNRVHDDNLNRRLFAEQRDAILDMYNQQTDVFATALPATPALIALRAKLMRELSQHCVLLSLSALRRGRWQQIKFHLTRAHQFCAWAGFDPGFIALWLALRDEARRLRQLRHDAEHKPPLFDWAATL